MFEGLPTSKATSATLAVVAATATVVRNLTAGQLPGVPVRQLHVW